MDEEGEKREGTGSCRIGLDEQQKFLEIRKSKSGISELHVKKDNKTEIASSDAEKAEILADFFTNVFTN